MENEQPENVLRYITVYKSKINKKQNKRSYTFRRSTIVVFLDIKAAFDYVDREIQWQHLSVKGVPKKYITL